MGLPEPLVDIDTILNQYWLCEDHMCINFIDPRFQLHAPTLWKGSSLPAFECWILLTSTVCCRYKILRLPPT